MTPSGSPTWTRAHSLDSLTRGDTYDVLVVGGGVIGSAIALDAAARGLSVALVEQKDFAAEASSRSTKLLHGGIRYLPHFEFGLVLYQSLDFIIPLYRDRGLADLPRWASIPALLPAALRMGLWLYDTLGNRPGPSSRRIDTDELLRLAPRLRPDSLRGGFIYGDAQTDDARLTISVLKTAVGRHGAIAANGVRAVKVEATGDGYEVHLEDHRDGREWTVRTRAVVSATWAFAPPPVSGIESHPVPVTLSKGVHLLLDPADVGLGTEALVLPETEDGRVLFLVPWRGNALFGTTDTEYQGPPGDARAEPEDVEYLMHHLHLYLDVGDVEPRASFAGVRALIDDGSGDTGKASRAHQIVQIAPGYVQVVGGKLTAYRAIAADATDAAAKFLGVDRRSTTDQELLIGAGLGSGAVDRLASGLGALGLEPAYAGELVSRYGTEANRIVDLLEASEAARTVLGDGHATVGEVVYAAQHEAAASVADVALRRTHLAWQTRDHGRGDAPIIAATLGDVLGWDEGRRARELAAYEEELVREGL